MINSNLMIKSRIKRKLDILRIYCCKVIKNNNKKGKKVKIKLFRKELKR